MTVSKDRYVAISMGQSGFITVLGQESKKLLFDLKMSGSCQAAVFSPCEKYLYSVGDQAEIY